MSSLLVTAGPQQGRRIMLRERTRIGRAPDNEIVLADHLVSRHHAELVRQGLHFVLHDMGSKNGLIVNGERAADRRLYRGDQLQIGKTAFLFETPRDVRPARYSDVTVHLEADLDSDMLIQATAAPSPLAVDGSESLLLLESAAQLLDCSGDDLAEAVTHMLSVFAEQFGATGGALLLRSSNGEALPLAAFAPEPDLRLSTEVARVALNEGHAVLASALVSADETLEQRPRRAILAPLPLRRDGILGAIYLMRPEGPDYTLEQLSWLKLLARMAAGALHCAMQREQFVVAGPNAQQDQYIGDSPLAQGIREQIRRTAASDATILLTGETGTGKELVACSIHVASARRDRPFVAIDCSSIPPQLLESELFGHEAGAFTGADRLKRGKIEMAEGGTLFLDEIGELQLELQPKLLRFLETLTFYRVGGLRPVQSDVRIIAATNRLLDQAVEEGRFRQDLLFRLNVVQLRLPALRDRREDVRGLIEHFAPRLAARLGKPFLGVLDEAWPWLEHYTWPGNVRELRHSLERALILSDDGILRLEHFQLSIPDPITEATTDGERTAAHEQSQPGPAYPGFLPLTLAEAEKDAILRALRFAGGNRVRAAEILEIHRNTLAKKIQDYSIQV